MIKDRKELKHKPIEIDLSGPEGNAFVLLGYARRFCKQLGYDSFKTDCIIEEMMLTDYEGLVYTFNREFGTFVTLWR